MTVTKVSGAFWFWALGACLVALLQTGSAMAQGQVLDRNADPVQEETVATLAQEGRAPSSFVSRVLNRLQNGAGFSLGATGTYVPASAATLGDQSESFTSINPRFFVTSQGKRSRVQLDYTLGYRNYYTRDVAGSSHSASASLEHRVSPAVMLGISNVFTSAFNDYALTPQSSLAVIDQIKLDQALYVPDTRFTTNQLRGTMTYRPGKRSTITASSIHDFHQYRKTELGDSQSLQLVIQSSYQLNRWLFLDNSFSHYLNELDPQFHSANIQKLQVGGFRFQPRPNIDLSIGGGVQTAKQEEQGRRTEASVDAAFTQYSTKGQISLAYHRGFSTTAVSGAVLAGDTVTIGWNRWLGSRVNFGINSGYTKGSSSGDGSLRSISGGAHLEIALHSHLLLTTNLSYISQRLTGMPIPGSNVNRPMFTIGLQYFLPSLNER